MTRPTVALVMFSCVLGLPGAGVAVAEGTEEEVERARSLFEVGRQAYERGRYRVAARAFREADRLAPRPALAFSLGQSYRLQYAIDRQPEDLLRAIEGYRQYLVRDPEGRRRGDAAEHLAELEQRRLALGDLQAPSEAAPLGTEIVVSASVEGARASIDDDDGAPLPRAAEVEPGVHRVRVEAEGYIAFETELIALEGRVTPLVARLEPKPAKLAIRGPGGAEVYVDGRPSGRLPLTDPVPMSPGERTVVVVKSGFRPTRHRLKLERAEIRALEVRLEATDRRRIAVGLLTASGVGALASAGLFISSAVLQGEAQGLLEQRDQRPLTEAEAAVYRQRRGTRNDLFVGGVVAAAVTGALFGMGGILALTDGPVLPTSIGPVPVDGGAGAAVSGRF